MTQHGSPICSLLRNQNSGKAAFKRLSSWCGRRGSLGALALRGRRLQGLHSHRILGLEHVQSVALPQVMDVLQDRELYPRGSRTLHVGELHVAIRFCVQWLDIETRVDETWVCVLLGEDAHSRDPHMQARHDQWKQDILRLLVTVFQLEPCRNQSKFPLSYMKAVAQMHLRGLI